MVTRAIKSVQGFSGTTTIIAIIVAFPIIGGISNACSTPKPKSAPLLPPGFEQSLVPNTNLDGFLHVAQGGQFVFPRMDTVDYLTY